MASADSTSNTLAALATVRLKQLMSQVDVAARAGYFDDHGLERPTSISSLESLDEADEADGTAEEALIEIFAQFPDQYEQHILAELLSRAEAELAKDSNKDGDDSASGSSDEGAGGPIRKASLKEERISTPPYTPRRHLLSQRRRTNTPTSAARRALSMQNEDVLPALEACSTTPLDLRLDRPPDSDSASLESPNLLMRAIDELSAEHIVGLFGVAAQPASHPPPLSALSALDEDELTLIRPPALQLPASPSPPSSASSCQQRLLTPAEFCVPLVRDLIKECEANESEEAAAFWQAQLEVLLGCMPQHDQLDQALA